MMHNKFGRGALWCAAVVLACAAGQVRGGIYYYWLGGSGSFHDTSKWSPTGVPTGSMGKAVFDLNGTHQASFSSSVSGVRLHVDAGDVTLDLNGQTYELTDTFSASINVSAQTTASTLRISGGTLKGTYARLSPGSSEAAVVLSGTNSKWSLSGTLYMGGTDSGAAVASVHVQDGAVLETGMGRLAWWPGTQAQVLLTGTGSQWTNAGELQVGHVGTGTLSIGGGAQVQSDSTIIGELNIAVGVVSVQGTLSNTGTLWVGLSGTGTLSVGSGALVTSDVGRIGNLIEGVGSATINGTWSNTATLWVGQNGNGTLTLGSTGTLTSGMARIGNQSDGTGMATVSGLWTNTGTLWLGQSGTGTLHVESGGQFTTDTARIGNGSSGIGTAIVDGNWATTGTLWIGQNGAGTLSIGSAGILTTDWTRIGIVEGSTGAATVHGTWTNGSAIHVAQNGVGSLLIASGAIVSTGSMLVGEQASGIGAADISGTLAVTSTLWLGQHGSATLTLGSTGSLTSDVARIANNPTATGTVAISGTWTNTGTLRVGESGTGSLSVLDAGQVLAGQSLLVGAQGTLTVAPNALVSVGSPTSPSTGAVNVGPGGTLSGSGLIDADVLVTGGTLSPGSSPGTLTITGDLHLDAASTTLIEIAGFSPGLFDTILVSGEAHLGGALDVQMLGWAGTVGPLAILTADAIFGQFDTISEPGFQLLYTDTQVLLIVPEPSSAALLLGTAALALLRRRRAG